MEKRELICIGCPMGCNLEALIDNEVVAKVNGNSCKIGENYAKKECTHPTRIVTTVVEVTNGTLDMVPCKTDKDIPKEKIFDVLSSLRGLKIEAPIKVGDVLIENICDTNVNIVATRSVT